jgi:hypothetical protein
MLEFSDQNLAAHALFPTVHNALSWFTSNVATHAFQSGLQVLSAALYRLDSNLSGDISHKSLFLERMLFTA